MDVNYIAIGILAGIDSIVILILFIIEGRRFLQTKDFKRYRY
jgi:hypothetical protein